jgi:hypothetical protein
MSDPAPPRSDNAGVSLPANEVGALVYTTKQMGDACEMLIAAELTLAGVPALKVPDNWPHYDVIAQPKNVAEPQRISVKSRTFKAGSGNFVAYDRNDQFDWIAIVLLWPRDSDGKQERKFYIVPRSFADATARSYKESSGAANVREWRVDEVAKVLGVFEDNFRLLSKGIQNSGVSLLNEPSTSS